MVMATGMYISLIKRIVRRHRTRDFDKTYTWLNLLVQINNLVLATSEHAPFLQAWYVVQSIACAAVLILVYKYWNNPIPQ